MVLLDSGLKPASPPEDDEGDRQWLSFNMVTSKTGAAWGWLCQIGCYCLVLRGAGFDRSGAIAWCCVGLALTHQALLPGAQVARWSVVC